jgi:hypothetical protein
VSKYRCGAVFLQDVFYPEGLSEGMCRGAQEAAWGSMKDDVMQSPQSPPDSPAGFLGAPVPGSLRTFRSSACVA